MTRRTAPSAASSIVGERRRGSSHAARRRRGFSPAPLRRGFSLVELLLAVFILAIGLISIGALFPAAIFQQRLSTDDATGPVVADNAFATLRAKLRPEMFGTVEEMVDFFGVNLPVGLAPSGSFNQGLVTSGDWIIQWGDWEWRRPAFFLNDGGSTIPVGTGVNTLIPRGSIAVFRNANINTWGPNVTASEVPWNVGAVGVNPGGDPFAPFANPPVVSTWGNAPQPIIFRPEERAYPLISAESLNASNARPAYRWEVMFRRFQGRILAAVFVFRVGRQGGEVAAYQPAANVAPLDPQLPPIPVRVQAPVPLGGVPSSFQLGSFAPWIAGGPDLNLNTFNDNARIPGTQSGSPFDAADPRYGWQATGQWILDQNNNVHRVLRGRRVGSDDWVLLSKPIPLLPDAFPYIRRVNTPAELPPVLGAWFLPATDANGNSLTPIYVTVKELF